MNKYEKFQNKGSENEQSPEKWGDEKYITREEVLRRIKEIDGMLKKEKERRKDLYWEKKLLELYLRDKYNRKKHENEGSENEQNLEPSTKTPEQTKKEKDYKKLIKDAPNFDKLYDIIRIIGEVGGGKNVKSYTSRQVIDSIITIRDMYEAGRLTKGGEKWNYHSNRITENLGIRDKVITLLVGKEIKGVEKRQKPEPSIKTPDEEKTKKATKEILTKDRELTVKDIESAKGFFEGKNGEEFLLFFRDLISFAKSYLKNLEKRGLSEKQKIWEIKNLFQLRIEGILKNMKLTEREKGEKTLKFKGLDYEKMTEAFIKENQENPEKKI